MKTKLALAITVVAFGLVLSTSGLAQSTEDNESGDINLSVSSTMKVDISPNQLNYTGISPGSYENETERGYNGIEIENKGSMNISRIYATSSAPDDRPFGTGAAGAYDSGNMIQLRPFGQTSETSLSNFHYISRREYNESNTLSYVNTQEGTNTRYGRFRTGNETFFWAINATEGTDTAGNNNCAGGSASGASQLMIGDNAHSKDNLGSVDFSDPSQFTSYNITADGTDNLGRATEVDVNTYEGTTTYDVFTWCTSDTTATAPFDKTFVSFRKFDREGLEDSSNQYSTSNNLINILETGSVSNPNALQPGEHFTVYSRISVPFGTAQGSIGQGSLTIYADQAGSS